MFNSQFIQTFWQGIEKFVTNINDKCLLETDIIQFGLILLQNLYKKGKIKLIYIYPHTLVLTSK